MNSTICAVSTAVGIGAISIIRVSGPEAIRIVNSVFLGVNLTKQPSHTIHYGFILEANSKIDEVLISLMRAPKTFTTEDIVEINCHGGIATTNKVLEILLKKGIELAEPGEFTKRAFLNGRIDLLKAEAIGDIINSETEKARKLAINQITGGLTKKITDLRSKIISVLANIEVNIDYPEYNDIEIVTNSALKLDLDQIKKELEGLINEAENGKIIKNGIDVVIMGKPNVGKSSILNAFLEEEKAIVTNIPGTTRDIVEGRVVLSGILLNFIDTAGIRETEDIVEKIGVQKSLEMSRNADLILYVIDNSFDNFSDDLKMLEEIKDKKIIVFINKSDISTSNSYKEFKKYNLVKGNTLDSLGLSDLKDKIIELFKINELETKDYSYLSSARHVSLIKIAKESIENAISEINNNIPIDMLTIDINNCYNALGRIIGETSEDDLINELFSKFCLGK